MARDYRPASCRGTRREWRLRTSRHPRCRPSWSPSIGCRQRARPPATWRWRSRFRPGCDRSLREFWAARNPRSRECPWNEHALGLRSEKRGSRKPAIPPRSCRRDSLRRCGTRAPRLRRGHRSSCQLPSARFRRSACQSCRARHRVRWMTYCGEQVRARRSWT